MQTITVFKDGKIINQLGIQTFKQISDGTYLVDIIALYPKTSEENRSKFFYYVRNISQLIGDDPQSTYERFKHDMKIESMKGYHTTEEWELVNKKFKDWVWSNLEIILR